MLMPKRVKYRKAHRGRLKGWAKGALSVDFGQYGLQALESAWVTSRQIDRMGKGKGAPEFWVAVVKPGRVLFELEGLPAADAQQAMTLAAHKLPMKTKFVVREEN
jgi:large subunit ribosomal protein L16